VDKLVGRVPLILTNPPFGEGKYDDPTGVAATVADLPRLAGRARVDPSLACLVRALRLLAPGGVLGIILPEGVIAGPAFEDLVLAGGGPLGGSVSLAAAVSLPTATFALSGTVAKTSAVFLRRRAPVTQVAVARVHHVGYLRQGGKAAPDPDGNELPTVAAHINAASTSRSPLVAFAPPESIRTLDPSRLDPDALAAPAGAAGRRGSPAVHVPAFRSGAPFAGRFHARTSPLLHIDDLGHRSTGPRGRAHADHPGHPRLRPGTSSLSLPNPSKPAGRRPADAGPGLGRVRGVHPPTTTRTPVLGLLYSPLVGRSSVHWGRAPPAPAAASTPRTCCRSSCPRTPHCLSWVRRSARRVAADRGRPRPASPPSTAPSPPLVPSRPDPLAPRPDPLAPIMICRS
jgi:hypothetical protein